MDPFILWYLCWYFFQLWWRRRDSFILGTERSQGASKATLYGETEESFDRVSELYKWMVYMQQPQLGIVLVFLDFFSSEDIITDKVKKTHKQQAQRRAAAVWSRHKSHGVIPY